MIGCSWPKLVPCVKMMSMDDGEFNPTGDRPSRDDTFEFVMYGRACQNESNGPFTRADLLLSQSCSSVLGVGWGECQWLAWI